MKCEKCGCDISSGTLCDNCIKSINYDPVMDLMNETEKKEHVVNQNKDEFESSIPIGDNGGAPETPVNENIGVVIKKDESVEPEVQEDVKEEVKVEEELVASQVETSVVEEKKSSKSFLFIMVAVILILVVALVFFFF